MSKTTTHVITVNSEAPERDELSLEELEAVSGGGDAWENLQQYRTVEAFKKALQSAGQV